MPRKKKNPIDFDSGLGFEELAERSAVEFGSESSNRTSVEILDRSLPKFGFITDTHFDYKYDSRKDDTLNTLLDKTRQCYRWFKESGCEFVIHGGDLFDRHRIYNFDLISRVREVLMNSGLVTHFIVGQHDLQGYNMDTLPASNLGFLQSICDGRLSLIENEKEVCGYRLVASHVDQNPVERVKSIGKSSGMIPTICICHSLLTDEREAFGTISIDHFRNPNVQLVLSGDLHGGVPFQMKNGIQFYNPGALARTERGLRMPKVGIMWWDGKKFQLDEFYPKCPSCEEIFFWDEDAVSVSETKEDLGSSKKSDDYIKSFQEFHSEAKDIYELLIKIGKKVGVSEEVLDLIKKKKDQQES